MLLLTVKIIAFITIFVCNVVALKKLTDEINLPKWLRKVCLIPPLGIILGISVMIFTITYLIAMAIKDILED